MAFELSIVNGSSASQIIGARRAECVEIVRGAYLTHADGHSVNPDSYFLRFPDKPDCRIIALPAYLGDGVGVAGVKWIASYPGNVRKGFPRASAVLVLNDYATGYPFAILEGSVISAARTAASAVLAAYWLGGKTRRAKTLGIVGTGLIARTVYEFLVDTGWEIEDVLLYDASSAASGKFRTTACLPEMHRSISIARDATTLLRASDLVLFTTVVSTPHVVDRSALDHNPLVLHLSLRDLSPEMVLASQNVVDDVEHAMKANTSVHLAEQQTGNRDFITGTLAQVMRGEKTVDRERPIVFSPFGLGILDLAVGKWVLDQAVAAGHARRFHDFFPEEAR